MKKLSGYEAFTTYCNYLHPDNRNFFGCYSGGPPQQLHNVEASEQTYEQLKQLNDSGSDIYCVVQPSVEYGLYLYSHAAGVSVSRGGD